MKSGISEAVVEEASLIWLKTLHYAIARGADIASNEPGAERDAYSEVVLRGRLGSAIQRLNPGIPAGTCEEALRKVLRFESASLIENNRRFHRLVTEGVDVEYRRPDGSIAGDKARLVDWADPMKNDWLAVNQFTVVENRKTRRADVVVFINGLPLAVIELKNPGDENATTKGAFNQFQVYKKDIPGLFA